MSHGRGNKPRWQLAEAWLLPRISGTAYKRITYTAHGGRLLCITLCRLSGRKDEGWVEGFYYSKIGTMTFKELFSQFSFAEIRPAFLDLWQTNEPKLAGQLDLDKWERIYQKVQALEAKSSPYYIRLGWRWETCSPMIDMNCSVYDKACQLWGS